MSTPRIDANDQTRAMYLRNPYVRVGKAGLEAAMEPQLHGEPGYRKVIVNARGVEQGEDETERREPVRGAGLVLTIDHELQRIADAEFRRAIRRRRGDGHLHRRSAGDGVRAGLRSRTSSSTASATPISTRYNRR